jgi:hypothetical protein
MVAPEQCTFSTSLMQNIRCSEGGDRLLFPFGIADREGNVYVSDSGLRAVLVYDSTGKFIHYLKKLRARESYFDAPRGYVADSRGCVTPKLFSALSAPPQRPLRLRAFLFRTQIYNSIPAIDADIKFAIVPASIARTPSRASSPFLLGASAPMPPI